VVPEKQGLKLDPLIRVIIPPTGLSSGSRKTRIETAKNMTVYACVRASLSSGSRKTRIETALQPGRPLPVSRLSSGSRKTRIETE